MSFAIMLHEEDPIPTRYSLLSRLQDWDDQESWKEFFDTYWRLIYAVALKSGLTESEAQDAVQETVISVAKSIHKFERDQNRGSFKGWLRNIARWRIADQLRKRARGDHGRTFVSADELPVDLSEIPDPAGASESVWEEEWQANLLEAAMERVKRRVKEEHYQIFDLYVVKHWPVSKVAKVLGTNIAQVYLAKHRVSALIKKEVRALEKRWQEGG
jgi:RNA polymerase sigma factor (sigma-70 family)